jgi:hypothetical protein
MAKSYGQFKEPKNPSPKPKNQARRKITRPKPSVFRKNTAPAAISYQIKPRAPVMRTVNTVSGMKHIVVNNEFVSGLVLSASSTTFQAARQAINPGLATFPWLSRIANNFQRYRWRKLKFHYVPSQATTITPGNFYMACLYDVRDPMPHALDSMMMMPNCKTGRLWEKTSLEYLPKDGRKTVQYHLVRQTTPQDSYNLYDTCALIVAWDGVPNPTTSMGRIFVEYEIEFLTPSYTGTDASMPVGKSVRATDPEARHVPGAGNNLSALPVKPQVLSDTGKASWIGSEGYFLLQPGKYLAEYFGDVQCNGTGSGSDAVYIALASAAGNAVPSAIIDAAASFVNIKFPDSSIDDTRSFNASYIFDVDRLTSVGLMSKYANTVGDAYGYYSNGLILQITKLASDYVKTAVQAIA